MYEYLSSELFKYMILFIIVACILSFYLLHEMIAMTGAKRKPTIANRLEGNANDIVQNKKIDCGNENIFSISDEQCRSMCSGEYVVKSGICVNKIILNYAQASNNVCDAARGFYSYMLGDGQLGTIYMHCLSIDPGIQQDNAHYDNIILKNGTIDIDYKKEFPQYKNGICLEATDDVVKIPSTMNVRERGVCTPKKLTSFFNI